MTSEIIDVELRRTPEGIRKDQMWLWTTLAIAKMNITEQIQSHSSELAKIGFKEYDALHIACAKAGCADVLLTTDDRMLRLAARHGNLLHGRVENPLQWLVEVT
ncbi:MAG: PIN domain-containing protein [Rhizonema sp. PD38]|nr:PIN domain-containing protein [Rhizonema sp. PD38]